LVRRRVLWFAPPRQLNRWPTIGMRVRRIGKMLG